MTTAAFTPDIATVRIKKYSQFKQILERRGVSRNRLINEAVELLIEREQMNIYIEKASA